MLHGFELVDIFTDEAVSGARPFRERPAGAKLWAALQPGDTIVALKLDRAFRDIQDATTMLADCREAGYGMVLADLGTDDVTRGSVSGLVFNLLASVSDFERQRAGDRIRDAKSSLKARQRFLGGQTPFGHVLVEKNGERCIKADTELRDYVLGMRARSFSASMIIASLKVERGIKVSPPTLYKYLSQQAQQQAA